MAYNILTLRNQVRTKLNDETFADAVLTQFANDTNRAIHNHRRVRYMETSATFTLTPGSSALGTLPSNYQVPISLRVTSPVNYAKRLEYWDYEPFDEAFPQPTLLGTGIPSMWYTFGTSAYVGPGPSDGSYVLELKYLKTPTTLSADSDVPNVPEEFSELMVLGMYIRALKFGENFDQAQVIQQEYDNMETDFVKRYVRRQVGSPMVMRHA